MRALNVIETGYRATIEEQDDTGVWITHAMKGAGADLGLLLRGNAVNYGVKGQNASGLAFGDARQAHPAALAGDLANLIEKGVNIYVVEEDVTERGLSNEEMIPGLQPVSRAGVARLYADYDRIWHW